MSRIHTRLQQLPALFSGEEWTHVTGLKGTAARVALARAQKRGQVAKAGPRSRLYFNCQHGPVTTQRRVQALLHLYPEAVLMGESVLRQSGWLKPGSGRYPEDVLTVAVSTSSPRVELDGFALHRRPPRWFRELADRLQSPVPHEDEALSLALSASVPPSVPVNLEERGQQLAPQGEHSRRPFRLGEYIPTLTPLAALDDLYADPEAWHPGDEDLLQKP